MPLTAAAKLQRARSSDLCAESSQELSAVRDGNHFVQRYFRSVTLKEGDTLYVTGHGKDVELLDPQAIANSSNVMNCEWMNGRMLYATSCLAANLEAGAGIIADTITAVNVLGEDVQNGFHRIGILEFA